MSDPGIELGDGVCDFEKVPPDKLYPSAKKRLTRVKVRVRVRKLC